ncbi:unnamed protein product [Schistosoma mattheei]|uniref:Uncharacterized protein n=1 Tax=Schistosoma mattheei TaxID=31246 RepID=A0A183Q5R1_9TREM|nr:unnamed protein product [Schistosoma mattheei]
METAVMDVCDSGVNLLPGERLFDLEYADDIVLLCDNAQGMQSTLNQLAISVRYYGMCFAPSKCKVILRDWQDSSPVLTLYGEQIVVEKLVYLGSCTAVGGGVSDEINARILTTNADLMASRQWKYYIETNEWTRATCALMACLFTRDQMANSTVLGRGGSQRARLPSNLVAYVVSKFFSCYILLFIL